MWPPWKQAPLKAELLRLLAEDANFRAAVREAMQTPATAKVLTAEVPAPAPVFQGPAWPADKATGPARAAVVRGGGA